MSRANKEQLRRLQDELDRCKTTCRNHWLGIAIPWVGRVVFVAVIGFFLYCTISELAGKTTTADIQVNASGSVSASAGVNEVPDKRSKSSDDGVSGVLINGWVNVFSVCLGLGGLLYGLVQAKLRRDYIELYAPLQAELEKRLDPNRSSSELTVRGLTRQEDL